MKIRSAARRRLAGVALAALTLLAALSTARASSVGAWQPLSGPGQFNGSAALDEHFHRLFTFGGDGTDLVRVLTLDGFPYTWALFEAAGTPPAVRSGSALVYDSAHDRLVVFGGVTPEGIPLNDVWALDLGGTPTWTELTPLGTSPDPRSEFGACYDPVSGTLFVFGGIDGDGAVLPNDLHALDLNAVPPVWSVPSQSGDAPSGRSGSPLAVDPAGRRLLLFGGSDGFSDLDDEYELDLETFTWTSSPMSGVVPEPRSGHLCVWDRNSSQLIVWGGSASDDSLRAMDSGSREWRALNWFIGPPQHFGASAGVFDWLWDRVVVLAGPGRADAWTFNKLTPTNYWYGTGPTSFPIAGSLVVDRAHARAIAYGGVDGVGHYTIGGYWQYAFTNPLGWNGVNTGGADPPARSGHLAVWDEKHDRMLVIGGRDETLTSTNTVFALSDSADFMNWKGLAPAGTPPSPRMYPAGIDDPVGDRVLLFGGLDAGNIRGGLHQLSLAPAPAWTTLAPAGGPTGRAGASAVYDEPRRRMILFGGADSVTGNSMNDVWALNLPGLTWTHLLPTGTPPAGRWKHTAVYDSRRGRMVLFGGRQSSGDSADVWQLDLVPSTPVWTRLVPTGWTPLYRSEASAVYDSTGDRMLIYGGSSLIAPNLAIPQEDLWGLQFSGGAEVSVTFGTNGRAAIVGLPWPNPARAGSRLSFALGRAGVVRADVYDLAGREVKRIAAGMRTAGRHELSWDGRDETGRRAAAGLYFIRVQLDEQVESRKVVIAE